MWISSSCFLVLKPPLEIDLNDWIGGYRGTCEEYRLDGDWFRLLGERRPIT